MNSKELASKVWDSLKGSTAKAKKFEDTVAVSFSLLSENNEDIFVTVRDGQLMVEPYHYDDNNCEVEASADIVAKMFAGELAFDKALKDGMIQIKSGDAAKLKALECLVPSKKTAAKSAKPAAAKAETKPAAKAEPKAEAKPAAKPAAKPEAKPAAAPAAKPEAKPAAAPTAKPEVKPAAAPAAKPEAKPAAPAKNKKK